MRHRERQPMEFPCSNANVKNNTASVTVCDNDPVNPFIPQEILLWIIREEWTLGKHMKNLLQRCGTEVTWGNK